MNQATRRDWFWGGEMVAEWDGVEMEDLKIEELRDALTGLWNGQWGLAKIEELVSTKNQFALLLCDIDGFRRLNCVLGHHWGDELLRCQSRLLEDVVGESGWVSRFVSDKFIVILPQHSKIRGEGVALKILQNFSLPRLIASHQVRATVSIGLAHFPDDSRSFKGLMHAVYIALLQAKRGGICGDAPSFEGRNCVVTWGDFRDGFCYFLEGMEKPNPE